MKVYTITVDRVIKLTEKVLNLSKVSEKLGYTQKHLIGYSKSAQVCVFEKCVLYLFSAKSVHVN